MNIPIPSNEEERLRALRRYDVLDSPQEAAFERLTAMAARIFDVPLVLVSLVDENRQWLKSSFGCDLSETTRDIAFCAYAILQDDVLVVPDATLDARFSDNPLVTGEPFIRFYAGAPLRTRDGFNLGTLCLLDMKPRELSDAEQATLADLAAIVVDELELRLAMKQSRQENEERRRAEEEVRQSEAHFRALIENAMDIITILDRNGVILYESPALKRIFGYSPDEVIGLNAFEFVHPDDLPNVLAHFSRRVSGARDELPTGAAVEFRFRHKDGSWRTLEAVSSISVDGADTEGIVVNSRDITERRRSERQLLESEERYKSLFDFNVDATISLDTQGCFLDANLATEAVIGYSASELRGQSFVPLICEGDAPRVSGEFQSALGGESVRSEFGVIRKDGHRIKMQATAVPIVINGENAGVFVIARDVTQIKQIEERLRLLESVVINANDAILITEAEPVDMPGPRILYVNDAFTRMTGYSLEDVVGKTPRILQGPKTSREASDKIRVALKRWKPVVVELLNYRKDRSEFWVEISIVPVADENGWFTHWVSVQRDIDERKQAERALEEARDEAQRANFAKSEFLSRMSHELRTPLNAILGFGQLLEEDIVDEDGAESVEQILLAGRHLLDLINEVLDLSRIESGRLEVSPEPVDLDELLRETLDLVRPLANSADVRMTVEALPREFYVMGDRQRLKQVLLNLLSNAVKYNRANGTVEMSFEESDNNRLTLRIRDSGIGIAPDKIARLFRPFERLGAENSAVEGTGLGLALSKRLVEAMGGVIEVSSAPGEGTTFSIRLPRAAMPSQTTNANDETLTELPAPAACTVLYIEDNTPNLRLIERVLARRGSVRLLSATTGKEGIETALRMRPDFILLDIHLPDIAGDEVMKRLRADDATRSIPIAILSADATPGRIERLLAAGADAYLTKPLDINRFLAVLEANLPQLELAGADR